jgi:hypothetical protein
MTGPAPRTTATLTNITARSASMPAHADTSPEQQKRGACGAPNQPGLARNQAPAGTSDPNVKMDLTET